jgi:hypothetical protein
VQNSTDRVCELCGDAISQARIRAISDVQTCVSCQERVESGIVDDAVFGQTEPREEVAPVEVTGGLIRKGDWSANLMTLTGTSGEIQTLMSRGRQSEARAIVQAMPLEAQAAIVALDRNPEQILSLTGMDDDGRPNYRGEVVSLLPTETIAGMVAVRPDEKVYNTALVRAMSPETFRRAVEETLEPIDDQRLRGKVSWEWMEAVASIDDPNRAADLLRGCDTELLEDALINRMKGRDLNKIMGGVNVFRFFSADAAGAVQPSRFVGGGTFGNVLDALFDAAPDLIRMVVRNAWERSLEDEESETEKEDEKPEAEEKKQKSEKEEAEASDEDRDISFWKKTE